MLLLLTHICFGVAVPGKDNEYTYIVFCSKLTNFFYAGNAVFCRQTGINMLYDKYIALLLKKYIVLNTQTY